jgi:hypothetical protein
VRAEIVGVPAMELLPFAYIDLTQNPIDLPTRAQISEHHVTGAAVRAR